MKTFVISYILRSGAIILNDVIQASNKHEAIQSIENRLIVLSCAEAKEKSNE